MGGSFDIMQRVLVRVAFLSLFLFASVLPAASEEHFLVRMEDDRKSSETDEQFLERLGFTYLRPVDSGRHGVHVHLVSAPDGLSSSFISELKRAERHPGDGEAVRRRKPGHRSAVLRCGHRRRSPPLCS